MFLFRILVIQISALFDNPKSNSFLYPHHFYRYGMNMNIDNLFIDTNNIRISDTDETDISFTSLASLVLL